MKSASRTAGVIAGSAAGFEVGGPAGAFVDGMVGGLVMDGITTGIDSAVHDEYILDLPLDVAYNRQSICHVIHALIHLYRVRVQQLV